MASIRQAHYVRLSALLLAATSLHEWWNPDIERAIWVAIMTQIDVFNSMRFADLPQSKALSISMLSLADSNKNWGSTPSVKPHSISKPSIPSQTSKTKSNLTHNLPHELISAILKFLPASSLPECCLVSRRWNQVTTPIMYGNPFLPTVTSISEFLCMIEQTKSTDRLDGLFVDHLHWEYHALTRSVTFSRIYPQNTPSDDDGSRKKYLHDDIIKTQSSLFRLFVTERTNPAWSFAHPIILRLLNACERLEEGHEALADSAPGTTKKKKTARRRNTTNSGQWHTVRNQAVAIDHFDDFATTGETAGASATASQPIQASAVNLQSASASSSSLPSLSSAVNGRTPIESLMEPDRLLSNLFKLSRRVLQLSAQFGLQAESIVDNLLLFLGLLESYDSPLWRTSLFTESGFKAVKKYVFDKLRGILNAISTSILIEVQYVTISSQKLLDAYCLLYYRALAHANALNLSLVLDILQKASRDFKAATNAQNPDSPTYHRPAKRPAHRVLQALQLMFHRNLFNLPRPHQQNPQGGVAFDMPPAPVHPDVPPFQGPLAPLQDNPPQQPPAAEEAPQIQEFDTLGGLLSSRNALREGLMYFAPGSMNSETAEFIEEILENNHDLEQQLGNTRLEDSGSPEYEENVEIAKCVRWMKEVVRWQRAGRQMEPVKDLLRRSMARIDKLRGVQRRYGLYFMD